MPRAGLNAEIITETAARIVDSEGRSALTIARVAEALGVRPPSLYNHVDGLDGLERSVAFAGIDELADVCRTAVMGLAGPEALAALAGAYRDFARRRPGVYALVQIARPADAEFGLRAQRVLDPVLAVLGGFGLADDELIHAARALRAAMHGFAALETQSGFGLEMPVDDSFRWMVDVFGRGLEVRS